MADENAGVVAPETPAGNPTPTPTPTPEPVASWIPQELRGNASLTKFKTQEEALKAYVNIESAFGKKFEDHLKPDADPAVAARVRSAMGVPEAASGYEDAKVPEGYQVDPTIVGGFKEAAFKAGMSKAQAAAMQEWFIGTHMGANTALEAQKTEAYNEAMTKLDEKWGAAKKHNLALVHQLVSEHSVPGLKAALDETGAGNHPVFLEWMANLASKMGEDSIITPAPGGLTLEDAAKEMTALRSGDQKSAYWNSSHAGHKEAVARMQFLTQYTSNAM
jgi:hypothetical protein